MISEKIFESLKQCLYIVHMHTVMYFIVKEVTAMKHIIIIQSIIRKGYILQIVKEGTGQEPTISWARNQVAVTKYKENERHSSSPYATYDGLQPVVNFQSFIDDNETIIDEVTHFPFYFILQICFCFTVNNR